MAIEHIETPTIGEILKEEFLDPLGLTAYRLAKELNVSTSSTLDLVHDRKRISADMALRLSTYFGNSYKSLASFFATEEELSIQELEEIQKTIRDEIHKQKGVKHECTIMVPD